MKGCEYRVTWQRVGSNERSAIFQTSSGAARKVTLLEGRFLETLVDADPDEPVCCEVKGCSCKGITWRQQHEATWESIPPLDYVVVERRQVGEWEPVESIAAEVERG